MPAPDWSLLLRTPAFEVTALLLGLVFGSFANVCIYRLPLGLSVVHPPSRCPACGTLIKAYDNLPVLGWLVLRGRCRACRAPISWRYPAVEATNGLLWLALAWLHRATPRTFVEMALVTALLVLSLIDLEHQILPDVITLPGTAAGLLASLLPGPPAPLESVLTAAGAYVGFAAIARAALWYYGQEALGQGDWKMAALLGAFLGWRALLVTVFLACLTGALVGLTLIALGRGSRTTKIPLGTFLGLAGIAAVFAAAPAIAWYSGLLHG
jgi:leader peptidase (prepilin peptidase)/N-methyltransferase